MFSNTPDRADQGYPSLSAEEQQMLQGFEHAATGLAILDAAGTLLDCNNAFARTLGYTSLELKRSKLVDQRHPADHDTWRQATQRLLAGETAAAVIDTRYIAKDGSWVWTRESISLVRHPAAHMVIISEDRTLQRMAERALVQTEGLVALGRLSASIAHELNNPLESITNLLFLISHGDNMQEIHHYARLAEQELERVTKISTQTLRFYRPQTVPAPVYLEDVLESVLTLFEGRLRREQVRVFKEYRPGAPPLMTYSGELRQVFVNLIGNALDAMEERGTLRVLVRTATRWGPTPSNGVRVTVADTGSGIPRAMLQKVFEPFVTTKEASGTGLGLWISKDIVNRHGGIMRVRSATSGPKRGTTMSVFLPAALSVTSPVASDATAA